MSTPDSADPTVSPSWWHDTSVAHPLDLPTDGELSIEDGNLDLFAVERPEDTAMLAAGLGTDCGNTLSSILCEGPGTLSTLFCLSSEFGSG